MVRTANSFEELKAALKSDAVEIEINDSMVATSVKAALLAKKWGPVTLAALTAAILAAPFTGGLSFGAAAALSAGELASITTIASLCLAIGGAVVVSIYTDWEGVEIGKGGIKLTRSPKK
ncbi:hypothetical protein [Paraburkholderia nemoris]|uniref:hypothetical protein n=1 Tax=Paraburkholderia nemoris TaxID=2793076 RepID=UPI001B2B9F94|nr:hypothetical protein [Paraburkholderia nemoris]CAE6724683.1 hypothetical protein LMG22931_01900 [Paraburkholderia nemoris]